MINNLVQPWLWLHLLTAVALATLWRRRKESRGRLLWVTVPFVGLTLLCTPVVAHLALGSLEWRYPPRGARLTDVSAIVVLSGSARPGDGARRQVELGEDTLDRCVHALGLYRESGPCLVIVSGGQFSPEYPGVTLAGLMHDFLRRQGVPEQHLLMEDQSANTFENAVYTRKLLAERGIDRIVLVTDAVSLLRAERCFRAQGIDVVPSGCHYRTAHFRWSLFEFLPSPNAARASQGAFHEWVGLAWYWLTGKI